MTTTSAALVLLLVAQDSVSTGDRDDRLELMRSGAERYEVRVAGPEEPATAELSREPLLRWTNPQRGAPDGVVFLWTVQGRPAATLCVYPNVTAFDHEWQSLAERDLTANYPGGAAWKPNDPGLRFRPLPEAARPAASAAGRLVQMRSIARGFSASVGASPQSQEVRLLTQPVYRYPEKTPGAGDGAIFAFVQGTDPEVFLVVESRESSGGPTWHYALARMSGNFLQCRHAEEVVWTAESDWPGEATGTYVTFIQRQPVVEE